MLLPPVTPALNPVGELCWEPTFETGMLLFCGYAKPGFYKYAVLRLFWFNWAILSTSSAFCLAAAAETMFSNPWLVILFMLCRLSCGLLD